MAGEVLDTGNEDLVKSVFMLGLGDEHNMCRILKEREEINNVNVSDSARIGNRKCRRCEGS